MARILRSEREPHIVKGSKLDRLMDKSHPTAEDLSYMESQLSAIENPSECEAHYLQIVRELNHGNRPKKGDGEAHQPDGAVPSDGG